MATFQITGPDGKKYRVEGENPAGAMSALKKMLGQPGVDPATNQPPGVPTFVPPGVEGYDPQTGERSRFSKLDSAILGAADTATFGFGDEISAGITSMTGDKPYDEALKDNRRIATGAKRENPWSYGGGQVGGGIVQGIAAAPATLSGLTARAGSSLLPRVGAGMADGAIFGSLYGAGSGESADERITEAVKNGGMGLAVGGALPVVASGARTAYESIRNALSVGPAAREAGASPEALRLLGNLLDADASLGPQGQANMARAGQEAMLVDAGPTARRALDTAIQRSGPGARVARDAVQGRVGRDALALTQALDGSLGSPQGVTATRSAIRAGSAAARGSAYDDAYAAAIDYADPRGIDLEQIVKTRVPQSAITEANALMRAEGNGSRQILAKVADDGSVTFETLPDVRQLDYITRGLNEVADQADGAGKLGGTTAKGRAYSNLSREIRDTLRDMVPEYGRALETAADPIRRSKAVELGANLLSPSMTRDAAAEAIQGMTQAERQALSQGVRSQIDDAMARVTRTVQDGDVPAREAVAALRNLSSRANRGKLALAIGEEPANRLFAELDRVATSFDLRASVSDNSATYARQAMDRRVQDLAAPGAIGTLGRGEPLNATKRITQALTGMTDEAIRSREDSTYAEIARLLTQQGGAGQQVYEAIGQIGQTDQATQLIASQIARALGGPHLAYPLATQSTGMLPLN